jgi:Uma2 family endonuclease
MSPGQKHERLRRLIDAVIEVYAEEKGIDVLGLGSSTFKDKAARQGFEPDTCFCVANLSKVREKDSIEFPGIDPPPDLIVEIDISNTSVNKFQIFSGMGIPEVWWHNGNELFIFVLSGKEYGQSASSIVLPGISAASLTEFSVQNWKLTSNELKAMVCHWVNEMCR